MSHFHRLSSSALLLMCTLSAQTSAAAPQQNRGSADGPVTLDFDMEDIPEPKERERSFYYDFLYSTFALQVKEAADFPRNFRKIGGKPKGAYNVNALGEVPGSSWFTNRNGKQRMTLEEIRRGPNRGSGPAAGIWKVIQGKTEGITPGFLIKDAGGEIYQLKFDPPEYAELATAAEVIASKLYYAAGYNVKENYIVVFDRHRLMVDEKAKKKDRYGRTQPLQEGDIDTILSKVARGADGSYRAVAGKYLEGVPKGSFSFEGVRKDDPNDWIPHEHRRDLRGLRVFCSWVNENDFREGNTLDMYVEEEGRRFLRHYIIDLGSSLGSDTIHPNIDRIGNEYQLDAGEIAKSLFSFGLYRRPWKGSSKHIVYPSVGFLEPHIFDPGRWKANYPVLPFENMTLQDAFWGTRLVLSFTDDQIHAAVATGEFTDPGAATFLARVLIQKRDKIGRYWLSRVNPLDRFKIEEGSEARPKLTFEDLEIVHGYVNSEDRFYEYSVRSERNQKVLISRRRTQDLSIDLGVLAQAGDRFYRISLWTMGQGRRQGDQIDVDILERKTKRKLDIVGLKGL